jgi:aspartokinase/homoserine dehydrogenase 1
MTDQNHPQESTTLVMKFGGTSVGTPAAMGQAAQIVAEAHGDWPRLVVVASALAGVTNLLLDSASQAVHGALGSLYPAEDKLRQAHYAIAEALVSDDARCAQVKQDIDHLIGSFRSLCQAIAVLGEATPRALDAVAGLGERMSVRLLAAALEVQGIPVQLVEATHLIVTDSNYQAAHPDFEATTRQARKVLEPILSKGRVAVVTGFIAANPEGVTTTLGRGGSDYSAAILGAVLPADDVWIWSDVDGVMSADPRLVSPARTIPELTYREISELAYFGAKVVHPKTIRPVIEAGIGLRICNTFNPQHPGTRLVADEAALSNGKIKAVTAIHGQRLITLEGRGMLGVPGVAARTFGAVASTGTSVPLISQASSEQSICFAVPAEVAGHVVAALEKTFIQELSDRDIDRVWATGDVSIITVVGAGMIRTPGIAGRVFSALGRAAVNVVAIAQGSSEVSISMVVDSSDSETAVTAIHDLIINGEA